MIYKILSILNKFSLIKTVYAHCDIPCGIYTVEPAKTAIETVIKMTEKIKEANKTDVHAISRYTAVKEEHAQICKEQLLILWTDYFKSEHLSAFENLHDIFWNATKLCSKVKQEVNMDVAKELEKVVEEIDRMFKETKK